MKIQNSHRIFVVGIFTIALTLFIVSSGKLHAGDQKEKQADSPEKIIHIKMSEFSYEPDSLVIPAGKLVRLEFENVGKINHEFMVGHKVTDDVDGFTDDLFEGVEVKMTKNGKPAPASAMMMGHHEMPEESEESEHHEMGEHSEGQMEHGHGMSHHGTMLMLGSGDKGSMTFTLPESKKGKWTIGCFTDGGSHFRAGMKGVLVVK
jgi:plastocyanin